MKIFLLTLSFIIAGRTYAQDMDDLKMLEELGITQEEKPVQYRHTEIKPEGALYLGYRFTDFSGSKKAFEYEHPDNVPVFGGRLEAYKYNIRLHADFDVHSKEDLQGDVNLAYGELLVGRWMHSTSFHNLDNIRLADLDTASSLFSIDARDGAVEYGMTTRINNVALRLKAPDFPAHAFFRLFYVNREGDFQQRSLLGSGFFQNMKRVTQVRDMDWDTEKYEFGLNSHLGHAEAEFSHVEKKFEVRKGDELIDRYEASAFRSRRDLPHNRVSELEGSSNTLKVHSNYNERVVASATVSIKERNNEDSGASADILYGAGTLQWTPLSRLSFFMKYTHTDVDVDNPSTASISGMVDDGSGNFVPGTFTFTVKPSISKTTDAFSLTGRYSPERGVTLKAKYSFENIERENADDWDLQDATKKHAMQLSTDLRMVKGLNFNAKYIHKAVVDPSYNIEPDNLDEGSTSVTWTPSPGINLLAIYRIAGDKRNDLNFSETESAKDRSARTDSLMGSGAFQLMRNLSLTTSYAYSRYRIKQDIVYFTGNDPLVDDSIPYEDTAHVYSASVNYIPVEKANVFGLVAYTKSAGEFSPRSADLLDPVSAASFSRQKFTETYYQVSTDYQCMKNVSCDVGFKYNKIDDTLDNIHDSSLDGHAYVIIVSVKKKWD
ncbi:MAG: MtrB/PioB family outer membrane beta-barrel protein [Nitrospirae bacterium]|nr:MtrB/PioB family outer membrane beta-barrel protein [Nitrospirota bacterium]